MNKNNRRDHLYSEALKLFLTRPYEAVSISDIEKASGMTRGAITYYGKDKMGLFHNVIKHFLVDLQNPENKISEGESKSLREFIESYIGSCSRTLETLRDIDRNVTNGSRGYMALILQTSDFFPDLNMEYRRNREKELQIWTEVLERAKRMREIREDTDTAATSGNFMNIFYGQSFLDALKTGLDTDALRRQFMNLYDLLII